MDARQMPTGSRTRMTDDRQVLMPEAAGFLLRERRLVRVPIEVGQRALVVVEQQVRKIPAEVVAHEDPLDR